MVIIVKQAAAAAAMVETPEVTGFLAMAPYKMLISFTPLPVGGPSRCFTSSTGRGVEDINILYGGNADGGSGSWSL